MRYLRKSKRNSRLSYQRRWPSDLQEKAEKAGYGKLFNSPTNCPADGDTVAQAMAQRRGNKEFERAVEMLRMATVIPTYSGLKAWAGVAKGLARTPEHTVHELLTLYHLENPETGKALHTRETNWKAFCGHTRDTAAVTKALEEVHRGLDAWQADMQARGLTGASIERQRNSVTSVLRWASRSLRLNWTLELKPIKKQKAKGKPVLSVAECQRLLEVVAAEGAEGAAPTAAMVALMLAGGVMPTEIARLDPEAVEESLGANLPYVIIGAQGAVKAEARRRVVPVVWPEAVLRTMQEGLPVAIPRAAAAADSSATVNKWLRTRGFGTTGHGLRHTLVAQAGKAMAHPLALARVGGWSAGLNPVMLSYGRDMAESELVRSLTEEVRRWWEPVLAPVLGEEAEAANF